MTDPETPTARALLEDPAILGRFPDDVNGIPGRGNLQWLRQHLVAIEAEARRADRPDPRVGLAAEVADAAPRPPEPVALRDDQTEALLEECRKRNIHSPFDLVAATRPPEPDRCQHTDADHERKALRDALTAYGHHADDCEYALTVCTCGFTEAMRSLFPAPRPPEPWKPSTVPFEAHEDDSYGQCVVCRVYVPHTDGEYLTEPFPCPTVRLARPPEPDRTADGQDVIDAINKAYWAGHEAAKAEPDRTAALEAENERLRADLATFTGEPDIRVRLEADRVTYWYNQTRLMDAKAERYRAALEWIAGEGGVGVHTSDCRCATHEASRALAATPEPAPVADGTVCDDCGQPRGALIHATRFGPPARHHFITPTPPTDGAACAG